MLREVGKTNPWWCERFARERMAARQEEAKHQNLVKMVACETLAMRAGRAALGTALVALLMLFLLWGAPR
jgi:hypothetical protein